MTPRRVFPVETHPKGPFPLLIALEGPPGGGKTLSALRLAKGIQKVRGGPIRVIDTEAGRSATYRSQIDFGLIRFDPPFRPSRFLEAIKECIALDSPACIIIDSLSDEHEGEGGVLAWHEEEVDRRLGDSKNDWRRREAMGQAGWIVPKQDRTRLISGILRITTPLIFTFRAREKTKPLPQQKDGRTIIVPTKIGYQAIAPAEICHAMTCLCLLPPHAEGKPVWRSEVAGEGFLLKRPNFLAEILSDAQLDEATGEKLAQWAMGSPARDVVGQSASAAAPRAAISTSGSFHVPKVKPGHENDKVDLAATNFTPLGDGLFKRSATEPENRKAGTHDSLGDVSTTFTNRPETAAVPQPPPTQSDGPAGEPDAVHTAAPAGIIDESERIDRLDASLAAAAEGGFEALRYSWNLLAPADQKILKAALDRRHKPAAIAVDANARS